MKISKHALRETRQLFRTCFAAGRLDENRVRQAVTLLLAKRPRGYVEILSRLHRLVKLEAARTRARVESPVPIAPQEMNALRAGLEKKYGMSLEFEYLTNPSLLGGLRIQVGSDLYDGSVKTRLDKLAQSF